ncbi:MAG: carbohydrate ABC transporter permease [Clostridiaceae bacterium]|nr:carbohydrate ABC transporter permease [Clostridiaceae bacterium]
MVQQKFSFFSFLKYLFITTFALLIIYPMLHILAVSMSDTLPVMQGSVTFYPIGLNFGGYKMILSATNIVPAYGNTLFYVFFHTILAMFVTTTGAYALSKGNRLWGYGVFMTMIVITMFFNGGMIPTYLTMKLYGLLNTRLLMILMGCVSTYNLIVMKSFFQSLPKELEDAGKIDGLNDLGVLQRIMLPLSTAILTTIALFYAVAEWNSYMKPFIYLTDTAKYPVQVLLKQMLIAGSTISQEANALSGDSLVLGETLTNATIIVSILPMIIIYPFLQKYFAKGVMIGSLKG